MHKASKIKRLIREIANTGKTPSLISATVKKMQEETCTIELDSGLVIEGVRLKATINEEENKLILKPKLESRILLLSISGSLDDLIIIKMDSLSEIVYKEDKLDLTINAEEGKLNIKNEETSLGDLWKDLIESLKTLKVHTSQGVSGQPVPQTIKKLDDIKKNMETLFK